MSQLTGEIMVSYAEIEKENDPKTTIIKYAKELYANTGRNLIIYYSGWMTVNDSKIAIEHMDKTLS